MGFEQRLEDSKYKWELLKASKCVTVYGSYNNGIKDILLNICYYLKNKGFIKTDIVDNRETPIIDGNHLNWNQKSYYYVDLSDMNLFFFFKNTDNQSVTLEAKYALPKYDRSLFFEEKEPNEEYGAIKSVFGTELDGIGISPTPFDRKNVYKVAHRSLFERLY
jgi:hypothetical protein